MNAGIRINQLRITYNAINEFLFGVENVMVIYFSATWCRATCLRWECYLRSCLTNCNSLRKPQP